MAKKILTGYVVSDKMQNTVVVEVTRKVRHPLYNKSVKVSKKYKADSNDIGAVFGDLVQIEETRPMSKDKYFKVIAKVTGKSEQEAEVEAKAEATEKKTVKKVTKAPKKGAKK